MTKMTRRSVVAGGMAILAAGAAGPAYTQTKQKLRFSSAFTETDLRAEAYKSFAAAIKDDFDFEPYWGNTLFKQGTELVALQRDNLDLCNLGAGGHFKADPGLVAADLGLSVPRRRPSEEDVQERRRPRIHQDGQGPARHPDHHAGLFRLAQP